MEMKKTIYFFYKMHIPKFKGFIHIHTKIKFLENTRLNIYEKEPDNNF